MLRRLKPGDNYSVAVFVCSDRAQVIGALRFSKPSQCRSHVKFIRERTVVCVPKFILHVKLRVPRYEDQQG